MTRSEMKKVTVRLPSDTASGFKVELARAGVGAQSFLQAAIELFIGGEMQDNLLDQILHRARLMQQEAKETAHARS